MNRTRNRMAQIAYEWTCCGHDAGFRRRCGATSTPRRVAAFAARLRLTPCGRSVSNRPTRTSDVDPEVLCGLPDQLRASQAIFGRTGGLHAAGLFNLHGELIVLREDVGRHNAVDKVVGWALANDRLPLSDSVLLVSGRGGFEIVQKALMAGIPVLASVSAPSDLAVNLAREFGMGLIGFLRGRRFVIYSGSQRIQPRRALHPAA